VLSYALNRASRSKRCRRIVEALPPTRHVVGRFVAGEAVVDAVHAARELVSAGQRVTIDVLGEDVIDLAGARGTCDTYIALLAGLRDADLSSACDVSLKLSALGQALPDGGDEIAYKHAYEICEAARSALCTVTLDMEDHTTVDATLAVGSRLREEFPWVGTVLQSNLKRTDADLVALAGKGTRIRIVKGAYLEPPDVAYEDKADVDAAYARHIDALLASDCYPMIATHDPVMLRLAEARARSHGRPDGTWECQMLYGIRTDLQRELTHVTTVRVYIPFGSDWYGYFMRRLAERPANVMFFLRALVGR
jgi:proline dehydrogenase